MAAEKSSTKKTGPIYSTTTNDKLFLYQTVPYWLKTQAKKGVQALILYQNNQ